MQDTCLYTVTLQAAEKLSNHLYWPLSQSRHS